MNNLDFVPAITEVDTYRYEPLKSTEWAKATPLPEGFTPYCYLCSVASDPKEPNPHRTEIEAFLFQHAAHFPSEDLCQKTSMLHYNRVVNHLPEALRASHRWWPQTVFNHLMYHVTDFRGELVHTIWKLRDYDDEYSAVGRKFDVKNDTYVAPDEKAVRMHLQVLKQKLEAQAQLARLK